MRLKHFLTICFFLISILSWHESYANHYAFLTSNSQDVILYSTSWCGYCRKAREFLNRTQIPYVEYDIEKSSVGKRQYRELRGSGVPLILVGNQQIRGWNPRALKAALARLNGRPPVSPRGRNGSGSGYPADDPRREVFKFNFIAPSSKNEHPYIIHLRDQRAIKVEEYWEEGDEIKYKKYGGILGFQRKDVAMIENTMNGTKKHYTHRK